MPLRACGREPEPALRGAGGGGRGRAAGLGRRAGWPRGRAGGGRGARGAGALGPGGRAGRWTPPPALVGLRFAPSRCEIETGAPGGATSTHDPPRPGSGGSSAPRPRRPIGRSPRVAGCVRPSRLTPPWPTAPTAGRVLEMELSGRRRWCLSVTL